MANLGETEISKQIGGRDSWVVMQSHCIQAEYIERFCDLIQRIDKNQAMVSNLCPNASDFTWLEIWATARLNENLNAAHHLRTSLIWTIDYLTEWMFEGHCYLRTTQFYTEESSGNLWRGSSCSDGRVIFIISYCICWPNGNFSQFWTIFGGQTLHGVLKLLIWGYKHLRPASLWQCRIRRWFTSQWQSPVSALLWETISGEKSLHKENWSDRLVMFTRSP